MSQTPITDQALESLAQGDFVTEFQEGNKRAKMLTPQDLLALRELEQAQAADEARHHNGIYRVLR